MRILFVFKILMLIAGIFCATNNRLIAQTDNSKAIAAADSSNFSPNKKDGWQLFNSYMSTLPHDSATLELIIQHANNFNWKTEQFLGKIKFVSLQPGTSQVLLFTLSYNTFQLRIEKNGKCWLSYVGSTPPADDPIVIPLKVFYKL